jgi:hypothetical protein
MKLLQSVGGIVSMLFAAQGFFWLWKLGWFGSGMGLCVMAFPAAIALSFGCYFLHLRGRIATLEKRLRERER